jgi:hypothetical protein
MCSISTPPSRVSAQPLGSLGLAVGFELDLLSQFRQDVAQAILLHRTDIEPLHGIVEAG